MISRAYRAFSRILVACLLCGPIALAAEDPPKAPVRTLEDIYGPSGANFQTALGFRVFEGDSAQGAAQSGFGVAVDDQVVQWRESRLTSDGTDCATSGACAVVEVDNPILFDGNGALAITVTDASPYRCLGGPPCIPEGRNDCNHNGTFADAVDDNDCNDNGTPDVVVRAFSGVEPGGEWVVADRFASLGVFKVSLPVSIGGDVPGVLFVRDGGGLNNDVTVRYADDWDGTSSGARCGNSSNPALQGIVDQGVNLVTTDTGSVAVTAFRIDDGIALAPLNDADGFPDTNELVDLYVTVWNKTGSEITNLTAQASVTDAKIECMLASVATLATLANGASAELPVPFRFKVSGTADRAAAGKTPLDDYSARFTITLSADQFDLNASPQQAVLDLDLDVQSPVGSTTSFTEGFESGLGSFTFMNLDFNVASNLLSDGMRCQYNNPDFVNSNSYGDTECYLGFPAGQSPVNDWHVHTSSSPDGGRAYLGTRSIHYGKHTPGNANLDTYGLSQMDALRTKSDINLAARVCAELQGGQTKACNSAADCTSPASGCVSATPVFSFKHQISTTDSRSTGTPFGQAADRAVIHALVAGSSIWQKLFPYLNIYDVQGTDNFSNCLFDPTDDGNDEDSYFDPTDPHRRLGPSSTCFPEFVFSYLGDTVSFSAGSIGRASDGPGLQGNIGPGTWVESRFDLSRLRGRSIKLRYVLTTIKVSNSTTLESLFMWNPSPADDGWYVDDVRVTQTLGASSSTVTNDTQNHGNTTCGPICNALAPPSLTASPPSLASPGQLVRLTTFTVADRCANGVLLFQFWRDVNGNAAIDATIDALLQDFSTDPSFEDAPAQATRYLVRVKCSSATSPPCNGQDGSVLVTVTTPGQVGSFPWGQLRFADDSTLSWSADAGGVEVIRGSLAALQASAGNFNPTVLACIANDTTAGTATDATVPVSGSPLYYLARRSVPDTTWTTFSSREHASGLGGARDAGLDGPPKAANACSAPPP